MEKVRILECTLRDGSYAIDFQFSFQDTIEIAKGLEQAGFRHIEVGHGVGLGAAQAGKGLSKETDENYLKAASQALAKAKFGMFFIPGIAKKSHMDLAREYGMSFIRIGMNANEAEGGKDFVSYAKKLGFEVHFNFMKSYALSPKEFASTALMVDSWGIDVLCVVDSAGCMMPSEVREYVSRVREKAKARVGFHGHNNLQLVVANALAALQAGATSIDSSLRGMGRSSGNVQTEILLVLLEKLGYKMDIDLYKTMDIAEKILVPLMEKSQGMTDIEVISGLAKFHSSFLPVFERIAKEYKVDVRKLIVEVSKKDLVAPSEDLIKKEAKKL